MNHFIPKEYTDGRSELIDYGELSTFCSGLSFSSDDNEQRYVWSTTGQGYTVPSVWKWAQLKIIN